MRQTRSVTAASKDCPPSRPPNKRRAAWIGAICALILVACAPTPTPQPTPPAFITVAQAPQTDAPILWMQADGYTAAWVGSDASGVHHDARRVIDQVLQPVAVLPLPPRHPYQQRSAPAAAGNLHLFWLDADETDENRLFSALLSPELSIERGSTRISDARTLDFALLPDSGGVWAAWAGGLLAEPSIFIQYVDGEGRPREPERAATNALWPAWAETNDGARFLFWSDLSSQQWMVAAFVDGTLWEPRNLTIMPRLAPGDRLVAVHAAVAGDRAYGLWSVRRADGTDETWLASGDLDAANWPAPRLLTVEDDAPVRFAVPLAGDHSPLPVVGQVGDELVLLRLTDGEIAGMEPITTLEANLIGLPGIYEGRDGLYAAWAEPGANGVASLNVTRISAE